MSKIVSTAIHWVDIHSDSLVILLGGLTGALWQTKLIQVIHDICTLQNIEGAIIVAIKAFIGAVVAWVVKTVCNYFKYKRKNNRHNGKNNNLNKKHDVTGS